MVVVFIKNNMVLCGLYRFMGAYAFYGFFYMLYNRRLFVKIDWKKIKIGEKPEPLKTGSSKNTRLGIISQNAHRW